MKYEEFQSVSTVCTVSQCLTCHCASPSNIAALSLHTQVSPEATHQPPPQHLKADQSLQVAARGGERRCRQIDQRQRVQEVRRPFPNPMCRHLVQVPIINRLVHHRRMHLVPQVVDRKREARQAVGAAQARKRVQRVTKRRRPQVGEEVAAVAVAVARMTVMVMTVATAAMEETR